MKNDVFRGILVGASLGVFAAIFGIVDNMPRAFFLGMTAGVLAGLTLHRLKARRKKC